jgi:hypothetical protein
LFSAVISLAKARSAIPARTIAAEFALLLLPTMAAAHIIKAILKMTSRIGYWPYALSDLSGIEAARKILNKEIVINPPGSNALDDMVSLVSAGLLVMALGVTFSIFRKTTQANKFDANVSIPLFLGLFIYWSIFALTILEWRF